MRTAPETWCDTSIAMPMRFTCLGGGPANLANLALLCHQHHHQLHDQQRWLSCTDNRTMTTAGWLDDLSDNPLTGAGQAPGPPR